MSDDQVGCECVFPLVLAYPGCPEQKPLNGCVCVCVCVTCKLTAKNLDRFRNPTLGNWVWATFTYHLVTASSNDSAVSSNSAHSITICTTVFKFQHFQPQTNLIFSFCSTGYLSWTTSGCTWSPRIEPVKIILTYFLQKGRVSYYLTNRGGGTVLKVGGEKMWFAGEASEKNFFVPPTIFLHVRGMSKQITISIEYTEICCLVVALIGLGLYYSRPIMNQRRRQFHVSVVNNIGTDCMHASSTVLELKFSHLYWTK